ncbi:hypothetical protein [Labrenzia sp. DG1229]|uniref:hypothetical protein n=1 Tax=Labrenzia sp. DG1229 TaxID=681847 RepID=UPI00048B1510|nr:hypothetical protein [Labrenzia sp. DG1229]
MAEEYELIRQFYAEEIRAVAALPESPMTDRLLSAFAAVPREKHVGPGPWLFTSPFGGGIKRWRSPDNNARHLYHNVLVALDEDRVLIFTEN